MKPVLSCALLLSLAACVESSERRAADQHGADDAPDISEPDVPDDETDAAADSSAPQDSDTPETIEADTAPADTSPEETSEPEETIDEDIPETSDTGEPTCERVEIRTDQGMEVAAGTLLDLRVPEVPELGPVSTYAWSVLQEPMGSASDFLGGSSSRTVQFVASVVGTYRFRVDVAFTSGLRCAPEVELTAIPGPGLYVELTWVTPGDADESDTGSSGTPNEADYRSKGSDMDLHLLHPDAQGRYFDPVYDCYWDNIAPEWGATGPGDDPEMLRDDTDGGGPEMIAYPLPEAGTYTVSVHYWDDWGYGNAFANMRVYVDAVLVDAREGTELTMYDMWDTHTIEWPSGKVTPIGRITPVSH